MGSWDWEGMSKKDRERMGVLERFFLLSEPWSCPEQALILNRVGAGVIGAEKIVRKVPWLEEPRDTAGTPLLFLSPRPEGLHG